MSDHASYIKALRSVGGTTGAELAADLLELHDRTGISLDNWETARTFVRGQIALIADDPALTDEEVTETFRGNFPFPNGA